MQYESNIGPDVTEERGSGSAEFGSDQLNEAKQKLSDALSGLRRRKPEMSPEQLMYMYQKLRENSHGILDLIVDEELVELPYDQAIQVERIVQAFLTKVLDNAYRDVMQERNGGETAYRAHGAQVFVVRDWAGGNAEVTMNSKKIPVIARRTITADKDMVVCWLAEERICVVAISGMNNDQTRTSTPFSTPSSPVASAPGLGV